jgi:hypothetical protein
MALPVWLDNLIAYSLQIAILASAGTLLAYVFRLRVPLAYSFIVNEVGEMMNFMRVRGPEIPDLEKELSQLRVVSPGFLGSNLVGSWCTIEITVGLSPDEIQSLIRSNAPPPGN